MRHVFYIVELCAGEVTGTNDVELAEQFKDAEGYLLIHSGSGTFWSKDFVDEDIETFEGDEDSEDLEE